MRIVNLFLFLVVAMFGCVHHVFGAPACLGRTTPHVGRVGIDESYGFLRRERERANAVSSSVVSGKILERLPSLILDASDLGNEPACGPDLLDDYQEATKKRPITYSRRLVGELRALANVPDVNDTMEDKAKLLIQLATLPDGDLTDYKLDPDEPGPAPPKSYVRLLAMAGLGHSNLYMNDKKARAWLVAKLKAGGSARELRLLRYPERWVLESGDAELVGSIVGDIRKRLGTRDAENRELVMQRLDGLGRIAGGSSKAVGELADEIIAARGKFALTEGVAGADRDLLRLAAAARYDLANPGKEYAHESIAPLRATRDAGDVIFDDEPAHGRVPASTIAVRLADLDRELAHATRDNSRCLVVAQYVYWPSTDDRFDALVAPAFDAAGIHASTETWCRLRTALALDGVSAARKTQLIARLTSAKTSAFDFHGSDGGFNAVEADPETPIMIAMTALGAHPEWMDDTLRAYVLALATAPIGHSSQQDEILVSVQPAAERLLAGPDGDKIARAWLADLATVADRKVTSVYPTEVAAKRILALAEVAPKLGLTDDARALFTALAPMKPTEWHHLYIARAATIAQASLFTSEN